ncbi:MAG: acetyl-CoA carboxylase carboxyltransferase subunit alpha [Oscillospiraceae bacterium]|jgi:acetyl-CoA carboxylase carboxyl transferase subunit alpha|nr:acetyl-CoA carboxylase carboxyltransferase subunit alpha [Oscillospiraceae bacterium]MCI9394440.1 acetyl-CoA carboxylase carboxyltransferase subunit alpha [Oscillospiraceae bacterium]MCI9581683.1 acetyl-CoA carboxylase carboxyltransferase subunit alpha [Oscillospiraceae bacterium]
MSRFTPEEKVRLARHPDRPGTVDFIHALFTDFFEQRGDRLCGEDASILGGIARFHGRPVTVVGHRKGKNLEENLRCNFGMPSPEGYRKAQRLMRQAEKFGRPVITFVDTPGAYPGKEAEERGQGEAIAQCLALMSALTVPVIAVITGEGGSGGALALAVANRVLMLEHAVYSVLSPEGFASILWKDAGRAGEACGVMKLTAQDLRRGGIVQGVLREPEGGAHTNWEAMFRTVDAALAKELAALDKLKGPALAKQRYDMFRTMGQGLPPAEKEEP